MKKYLTILLVTATSFTFADDENYDGQTIAQDFSGMSMNYSSWKGAKAYGSTFVGTKLKEADFSSATLVYINKGADFTNSNLTNAVFDNAVILAGTENGSAGKITLTGATIKGASFKNVVFAGVFGWSNTKVSIDLNDMDLTNVDFSGGTFCATAYGYATNADVSVKFTKSILNNTKFNSAVLSSSDSTSGYIKSISVNFSNLNLTNVCFDNAILASAGRGSYLLDGNLLSSAVLFSNSTFSNVSFKNAVLSESNVYSVSPSPSVLPSASVDFSGLDLSGCDFTGAIMSSFRGGTMSGIPNSYSSVTMVGSTLKGTVFDKAILSASTETGVDFSNADLTNASFVESVFTSAVNLSDADITNADFSSATGLTTTQLSQTKNYKDKNLSGVKFGNLDLSSWILRNQNLQNTSFVGATLTNVNIRGADLRGADFTDAVDVNSVKTQNTIWSDGTIKNVSLSASDETLTIRKYIPTTSGGDDISAKISEEDVVISDDASIDFELGARLEVTNGKSLTVEYGNLNIDTDLNSSTKLYIDNGAGFYVTDDTVVNVNILGSISEDQSYTVSILEWANGANISELLAYTVENAHIFLTINGESYTGKWDASIQDNSFVIGINVPEPAEWAMILGVLALGLTVYRKRK